MVYLRKAPQPGEHGKVIFKYAVTDPRAGLYFIAPDNRLMAVAITPGSPLPSSSAPTVLFQMPLFNGLYSPSPDGQRFLIATPAESTDVVAMEVLVNPLTR